MLQRTVNITKKKKRKLHTNIFNSMDICIKPYNIVLTPKTFIIIGLEYLIFSFKGERRYSITF